MGNLLVNLWKFRCKSTKIKWHLQINLHLFAYLCISLYDSLPTTPLYIGDGI